MPRAFTFALAAIAASVSVAFPRLALAAPGPGEKDEKAVAGPARKRYNLRNSSTYDGKKQRLGLTGPSARPEAVSQKAVAGQHASQELAAQKAGGTGERCGQMSAEVAKTLGHPSAAHALGSTPSKHSSTVSASARPTLRPAAQVPIYSAADDVLGFELPAVACFKASQPQPSSSAHIAVGARSEMPAVRSDHPRSTIADRMRRARQLVGDRPLAEVAEKHPKDALRVYISKNFKPYNDESPEFLEKLRIFTRNCEITRTRNAEKEKEGRKPIVKMNLMADEHIIGEGMRGEQMDRSWKPSALVYETTRPKALTAC